VAFGSAKMGWGFTLNTFVQLYSKKFNMNPQKLREKLWGDNFWDESNKKWHSTSSITGKDGEEKLLPRGFCQQILDKYPDSGWVPILQTLVPVGDQER